MKEKKGFGGFWKKLSGSRELSLVAVLVLLSSTLSEVLYAALDPRVRS